MNLNPFYLWQLEASLFVLNKIDEDTGKFLAHPDDVRNVLVFSETDSAWQMANYDSISDAWFGNGERLEGITIWMDPNDLLPTPQDPVDFSGNHKHTSYTVVSGGNFIPPTFDLQQRHDGVDYELPTEI